MLNFSFVRPDQPVESTRLHNDIQVTIDIGLSEQDLARWMGDILSKADEMGDSIPQSQMAELAEDAINQLLGG